MPLIASLCAAATGGPASPNILLIVWDDLGIDQAAALGWTHTEAQMPVFAAICALTCTVSAIA